MSDSDPVVRFPPEVTLRMLEFAPISSLASLTAVSKDWHGFIDVTHQEAIYSKQTDTTGLNGSTDLAPAPSFSQYLEGANSSKELCKRQTLLSRNWRSTRPMTTETVLQLQGGIQQFRADFSRRFFISTSLEGLHVTDMDSGTILWSQPFLGIWVDQEPYIQTPRLEYEDGVAVLNRLGRALEVWHTGVGNLRRGEFGLSRILTFEFEICRFHLSAVTLGLVNSIGDTCTWDLWPHLLRSIRPIQFPGGVISSLYGDSQVLVFSTGRRGIQFYDTQSGESLGILKPGAEVSRYHILLPDSALAVLQDRQTDFSSPPDEPRDDRLVPLTVMAGPLPGDNDSVTATFEGEEWETCTLDGKLFVGLSSAGSLYICPDWRQALQGQDQHSAMVQCDMGNSTFESDKSLFGLSVKNHRIMFDICQWMYIVALDSEDRVQRPSTPSTASPSRFRPSYAYPMCAPSFVADPVSDFALFDDCVMSTCSTLPSRPAHPNPTVHVGDQADGEANDPADGSLDEEAQEQVDCYWSDVYGYEPGYEHRSATKMLRILSFAPQDVTPHPSLEGASSSSSAKVRTA
ncbi:tRNA pseudouridine synthase 1 [Friedmanniomyces endolithicus]|nr:tRNA pseudouridine synthase 1 [Friedmanniomyces endolithicus]